MGARGSVGLMLPLRPLCEAPQSCRWTFPCPWPAVGALGREAREFVALESRKANDRYQGQVTLASLSLTQRRLSGRPHCCGQPSRMFSRVA